MKPLSMDLFKELYPNGNMMYRYFYQITWGKGGWEATKWNDGAGVE